MLKDTKSLGNNKAPACESRGFVHKKEGAHFDTPSNFIMRLASTPKSQGKDRKIEYMAHYWMV